MSAERGGADHIAYAPGTISQLARGGEQRLPVGREEKGTDRAVRLSFRKRARRRTGSESPELDLAVARAGSQQVSIRGKSQDSSRCLLCQRLEQRSPRHALQLKAATF